ncbi:MAG: NAD-dependent deacetylase [Nitrospirae bacterium]|nr:NAD-dependent deacetylase [Nitrospirota bacterium]
MTKPDDLFLLGQTLKEADGLIVTAGAGMGVDSGLPDFRGPEGFWNSYPALGRAGIRFEEIANPRSFDRDPVLAWGFYGHRLALYRHTRPHEGFGLLYGLSGRYPRGAFVFTSNVDGQFELAGFPADRIVECHGSIHVLQCLENCRNALWNASDIEPAVEAGSGRLLSPLPRCPHCGGLARPNILMFGDFGWNDSRTRDQEHRFRAWRRTVSRPVVIEIGAGTAIPTVRLFGEAQQAPLVRINPRDWRTIRPGDFSLPLGALDGIRLLLRAVGEASS